MPLIYITGIAGSGKSAVREELKRRGYEAHGTDEDGIGAFYTRILSRKISNPDSTNPKFRARHVWKIQRDKAKGLVQRAKDKPIYLCGVVTNDIKMRALFKKIIVLVVDDETIKQRLANRTDNNYGQNPKELKQILGWNRNFEDRYCRFGATSIDAGQPLSKVVDEIITKA